jgi:formamidopyrimidine-DNA glycosylase
MERPDLEYVVPILEQATVGTNISAVRSDNPVVVRVVLREPVSVVVGRTIGSVRRRSHFILFSLGAAADVAAKALEIVVAPMLAGRFTIAAPVDRRPADLAFTLLLSSGQELRFRDDVQMAKVYLIEAGAWTAVPGLAAVGVDVLDPQVFTRSVFRELASNRRDQAKVFLMDKTVLDSLGNAYADEVLFEAGVHPKAFVRSLSPDRIDGLHDAIVSVLQAARAELFRRAPPLGDKVRDFLKVRNRHGQPCPRCGAKIRRAGVHGHDAFFCPECQPDGRASAIVSWTRKGTR